MLFEAGQPAGNSLNAQSSAALLENLRKGQRLLFTFGAYPGQSVFWLSRALPSTGWTSQQRSPVYGPKGPVPLVAADPDFFHGADLEGFAAPLGVDIRPVSAVERGQARYERYQIQHPFVGFDIPPHSDLWSRPLLNRDWTVRICYDDIARLPLLVTGRYGAGRVAMLSTSSSALGESPAAKDFWRAVVRWLSEPEPASPPVAGVKPTLAMSFPSSGSVRLTIGNPSKTTLPVQLVMRALDRNGAMLGDAAGELLKPLSLPPGRSTVLNLPLPAPALPGLETYASETSFQVRAGLLSGDGSSLLAEQRAASPPPPLSIEVAMENVYSRPVPYPGPGTDSLFGFQGRMGLPVATYAYPPGSSVQGTVTIALQTSNLAPTATIEDLTQPGNASVIALNDRGAGLRRTPGDHIQGYGTWVGKRDVENVLRLTLPEPAHISAVTLVASGGGAVLDVQHNPGRVAIELDGRPAAMMDDLDAALNQGNGQVRIQLPQGASGSTLTVRLPWVPKWINQNRAEPCLAEIAIEGRRASEPALASQSGKLTVVLVDVLRGERTPVLAKSITLGAGQVFSEHVTATLPHSTSPGIFRLEAVFHPDNESGPATAAAPLLAIASRKTLTPMSTIASYAAFGTGLLVSRGFTLFFPLATGTSEPGGGWGHSDDLIWAYSRQFKAIPPKAKTAANRLYATETDMRHYTNPWHEFGNGEPFFQTAIPSLIQQLKTQPRWAAAPTVVLTFADGWGIGPELSNCNSWQEYVAFDSYLRSKTGKGINGRTHPEVETAIHAEHENQWQAWQLERYVDAVRSIRAAFKAEGKDVVIYGQGCPVIAGEAGRELAKTIRGMNDDTTWSMQDNSPSLTTGRTLACLAFNPVWQLNALMPWGFVSPLFNNWQWHNPIGTTEPSRRLHCNNLWRAVVWADGSYGGAHTYGFGNNVGTPFNMTTEEYQQWWNLQQRGNLLQPESPLGAGLVISSQKNADPASTRWNGIDPTALPEVRMLMDAFRSLVEAGVSLPFTTNASTLSSWKPTPGASLIVLNLQDFSAAEIDALSHLQQRGVRIAAFASRSSLSSDAASLFKRPGSLLLEAAPTGLTHPQALELASRLIPALELPLTFSTGFAGYGFRCQDLSMIVLEDWLEQARAATVRLRKSAGAQHASASNLNDHSTLTLTSDGEFWKITVPMRSGDAALLAVREA
ncbi:MAG: hypothetical protein PW789_19895 [Edaphobacter sp.]|uniref:hypothetical protein n=1 Tax=Edaphobacter sp. TaxID=1934404 RepID=UPI00239149D4|nr:hypothetical protein [Edaphobacter sp.]MDE1178844.1 hypothetical protein [Edaphobacter sp.]